MRQEGINFLGFNLTWRQSRQGRGYLHVEPGSKSRSALRDQPGSDPQPLDPVATYPDVVEETNRAYGAGPHTSTTATARP